MGLYAPLKSGCWAQAAKTEPAPSGPWGLAGGGDTAGRRGQVTRGMAAGAPGAPSLPSVYTHTHTHTHTHTGQDLESVSHCGAGGRAGG